MHFKILNRVLGFMFLFSNLVASLPAGNAISQPSALETLESRALSDDSISTAPNTVTDVSVDHNEIPTAAVRQPPATTLATVLSTATSTPAKGSENSKQYAYYMLQCIIAMSNVSPVVRSSVPSSQVIGPSASECYKRFGTQCNSSTGEMTGEAPALFTHDFNCMQYMGYYFCQDVSKAACIHYPSCT